jgi:hypothetical protein
MDGVDCGLITEGGALEYNVMAGVAAIPPEFGKATKGWEGTPLLIPFMRPP